MEKHLLLARSRITSVFRSLLLDKDNKHLHLQCNGQLSRVDSRWFSKVLILLKIANEIILNLLFFIEYLTIFQILIRNLFIIVFILKSYSSYSVPLCKSTRQQFCPVEPLIGIKNALDTSDLWLD